MRQGWQVKKLVEVCTLQRGFDLPTQQRKSGRFPLVSSSGISDAISESKIKAPGIVTGRSGSIGSVFYIDEDFWPLNTVLYVKDFHGNDVRFIYYLLNQFNLQQYASGTGVPTLNRNHVHDIEVAVPSLPEQQRIVAVLDESFAGIATATENAKKNLRNAKELFENYLQSLFSPTKRLPKVGWHKTRLADLVEVQSGSGFPTKYQGKVNGGIPFYKVSDMNLQGNEREMFNENNSITEEVRKKLRASIFPKGSIIFPKVGGAIATNKKRLVAKNCCVDNNVMGVIPKKQKIDSEFLYYFFLCHNLSDFANKAHLPSIKKTTVENWELCVPESLVEQRKIVHASDALSAESKRLEAIYQQKLDNLAALKQSILQKAFAGELHTDRLAA